MPCASCGRWDHDWINWIHWNRDHGDDMINSLIWNGPASSRFYFCCCRPVCQRTKRLSRPVFTASVQEYMRIHYGTIYDKRGNIVWRLDWNNWWHPANPANSFNWMICKASVWPRSGGMLLQDDYPMLSFHGDELVANDRGVLDSGRVLYCCNKTSV